MRFVLIGRELQLVRHEFAAFIEKDCDVIETVQRNDALLEIDNLGLVVHVSARKLILEI